MARVKWGVGSSLASESQVLSLVLGIEIQVKSQVDIKCQVRAGVRSLIPSHKSSLGSKVWILPIHIEFWVGIQELGYEFCGQELVHKRGLGFRSWIRSRILDPRSGLGDEIEENFISIVSLLYIEKSHFPLIKRY